MAETQTHFTEESERQNVIKLIPYFLLITGVYICNKCLQRLMYVSIRTR